MALTKNTQKLRNRAQFLRVKLQALKEQCRHPKESIVNALNRTYCSDCNQKFWPVSGWAGGTKLASLELKDIAGTRSRLKPELDDVLAEIKKQENLCRHPEEKRVKSCHPDYGDTCGDCGIEF
ncbi:hypothetical protein HYT01_03985 [Candidatus Giovannonibacteria bacterium]|nr:hypothetical protein [Candidatus Giovannonibacteria bacterium]